jgi:transposase
MEMQGDGRALAHSTLEAIRLRTVHQIVDERQSPEVAAKVLGFNRRTIYKWLKAYQTGGQKALLAKPLLGRPSKLNARQKQAIYRTVEGKSPLQLKFPYALWTREMIQSLIMDRYQISLSLPRVGAMLKEMGLTVQKPQYRAWQQDGALVEQWKQETYPALERKAKREKADIYFGDEAGVRSDYHAGTTWAPRGKTPVVATTGARFSVNMISAISPRGQLRFMLTHDRVNAGVFLGFLNKLMHNADRKIILILDNASYHKTAAIRDYVASTHGMLEIVYLPPYAPQLNPDESVWREVKAHRIGRSAISGPDHLQRLAHSALMRLQRMPDTVRGLFHSPALAYISTPQ